MINTKEERKALMNKILELFKENNIHYEFYIETPETIEIYVNDGDWKHDHAFLKNVMRDAGYTFMSRHIVEAENTGDDSFTAIYHYHV